MYMSVSKSTAVKKQVAKKVVTPKKSPASTRLKRVFVSLSHHKLIIFLIFLVLLFPLSYAYERYKDWDNAQMIKGLAKDFPALVADIEAVTSLDLEVKYDCMKTQEKFNDGVNVCELRYYAIDESNDDAVRVFEVISKNNNFIKGNIFSNQEGYKFNYRNKRSCSFTNRIDVYGSCIIGVRETNLELAKNLLVK